MGSRAPVELNSDVVSPAGFPAGGRDQDPQDAYLRVSNDSGTSHPAGSDNDEEGGRTNTSDDQPQGWFRLAASHMRKVVPFHEIESYQQEFSGMLGDLGLYIPLVIALSLTGQIGLGPTLVFSGLANIITGMTFTVPMCVQPMKSISTVALSDGLTNAEIMASGLLTSAMVFFLGVSNLIVVVNKFIPDYVVRGLQLGLGLSLFRKASQLLPNKGKPSWDWDAWVQWDGFITASIALAFAIVFVRSSRVPTALCLFLFGLTIAAVRLADTSETLHFGLTSISVVSISSKDWLVGLLQGALPQIPTTLLNSVIAVCRLAEDLYPERATGVTVRRVASSVGGINLIFCWFGGLPMCHGAGGLAGQHRFGARTNLSILTLGACKLLLGVCFSRGMLELLQFFPGGVLASMLAVSGFELASAARSALTSTDPDRVRLCLLTACFTLFFGTAVGFAVGLLASALIILSSTVIGPEDSVQQARSDMASSLSEGWAWLHGRSAERKACSTPPAANSSDRALMSGPGSNASSAGALASVGSNGQPVTSLSRRQAAHSERPVSWEPVCC